MSRSEDETPKSLSTFLMEIVLGFIVTGIIFLIWSDDLGITFGFWSPWSWGEGTSLTDGLTAVWPLYVWGIAVSVIAGIVAIATGEKRTKSVGKMFAVGFVVSIVAGVTEEIAYRWLRFMGAIFGIFVLNWLVLGFAGVDIVKWLFVESFTPVSNWLTLGHLEPQLLHMAPWLIGAAIVSANGDFRDQHKYLGFFGYVNSWFGGMVLFWVMFNYGLVAAILAHIIYDVCVFWSSAIVASFLDEESSSLDRFIRSAVKSARR